MRVPMEKYHRNYRRKFLVKSNCCLTFVISKFDFSNFFLVDGLLIALSECLAEHPQLLKAAQNKLGESIYRYHNNKP